jgi:glycosyltransferase involved in cell wall biosynthesis
MAKDLDLNNVIFVGNIPRSEMPSAVAACDAYIVPLKKNDLFLGAVPSKLFEPLAMGKPILLGVDGEARELFINQGQAGLFFEPENVLELENAIMSLVDNMVKCDIYGENGRLFVKSKFNRIDIAKKFYLKLKQII